jgi:hypothetical protein
MQELFSIRVWKPAAVFALLAAGFVGGRLANLGRMPFTEAGLADPAASRVSYVEPSDDGRVQLVVDETRRRVLTGRLEDENIRRLLLAASRDPDNPGLRAESVAILTSRPQMAEFRTALISSLLRDQNAGVRLKALEGLKPFAQEPEVRKALSQVLLTDSNPGVRTQAIDLLTQSLQQRSGPALAVGVEQNIVGVLQELMRRENNPYVQQRCRRALEAMNASVETY